MEKFSDINMVCFLCESDGFGDWFFLSLGDCVAGSRTLRGRRRRDLDLRRYLQRDIDLLDRVSWSKLFLFWYFSTNGNQPSNIFILLCPS